MERKVWASEDRVPDNVWEVQAYGKCHRKYTALILNKGKGEKVSVRAHRASGNIGGRVNPTRSKTK